MSSNDNNTLNEENPLGSKDKKLKKKIFKQTQTQMKMKMKMLLLILMIKLLMMLFLV
jgi:hypothetical protein